MRLRAALERPGNPHLGRDAGELIGVDLGAKVTEDVDAALDGADVLIDFTRPEATLRHLEACARNGVGAVIGTTGFDAAGKAAIADAARRIPVVFAPNMSVGVNLALRLLDMAARVLDEGFDIEIVEAHHRHKVDAPSGTALRMGEVVAAALGRDLKSCAVYGREGVTGEREPSTIGFATFPGADLVLKAVQLQGLDCAIASHEIFAKYIARKAALLHEVECGLHAARQTMCLVITVTRHSF